MGRLSLPERALAQRCAESANLRRRGVKTARPVRTGRPRRVRSFVVLRRRLLSLRGLRRLGLIALRHRHVVGARARRTGGDYGKEKREKRRSHG